MTRMVDVDNLVSPAEIADVYPVTLGTVYEWALRPDFPPPVATFSKKFRVWLLSDVDQWVRLHDQPEPSRHGTHYRYGTGCRCDECRAAKNAYMRAYRRRRAERAPSLTPVGADEEVGRP